MSKFIITTNSDSADILMKLGFQLVNHTGGQWVFLNSDKLVFSNLKNVSFSNILNV